MVDVIHVVWSYETYVNVSVQHLWDLTPSQAAPRGDPQLSDWPLLQ